MDTKERIRTAMLSVSCGTPLHDAEKFYNVSLRVTGRADGKMHVVGWSGASGLSLILQEAA